MMIFSLLFRLFLQSTEPHDEFWTHFGILAVPTLMILGFWLDYRRRSDDQHEANQTRMGTLEKDVHEIKTQISPLWDWWNDGRGKRS